MVFGCTISAKNLHEPPQYATITSMKRLRGDAHGSMVSVLAFVVLGVGLVGAIVFGVWAFAGQQDYKKNVDAKIATAVEANTKKVKAEDAVAYAEASKNPLKTYVGPVEFGTVRLQYPRNWSVYVASGNGSTPVSLYAYPEVVPSVTADTSNFALRMEVVDQKYSVVLKQFAGQLQQGGLKIKPYVLPQVAGVTGARLDGQLSQNKKGSMVILPVRDKTLKLWTESDTFIKDFDASILPNASFQK